MDNVQRKELFEQVCVWPGTVLGDQTAADFEEFMMDQFNVRVQYLETVDTYPDTDDLGNPVQGTGDRSDLFFAIHKNDIAVFAVPRLEWGIRWVEDVLSAHNYRCPIYPQRVFEYKTW